MVDVERLKKWYDKNWCRKDQLMQYVELRAITKEDYEWIAGEPFPEAE